MGNFLVYFGDDEGEDGIEKALSDAFADESRCSAPVEVFVRGFDDLVNSERFCDWW